MKSKVMLSISYVLLILENVLYNIFKDIWYFHFCLLHAFEFLKNYIGYLFANNT